jgi:hypothetical protein
MNALTKTIITIMAINLLTAVVVPAGNVPDKEIQAAVEVQAKKADIEQKNVEAAAVPGTPFGVFAQANQTAAPAVPDAPSASTPPLSTQPPVLPSVNRNIQYLTNALSFGPQAGSGNMVLVIPSGQIKTEDLISINEDMNVMSRIFEKNLEQDRITTARGNFFGSRYDPFVTYLGGSRGDIQSMYLQGYGALFLLKVDFPLSPSPDVQQEQQETKKEEQGDPVWRQMRQEIYEPENVNRRRRTEKPEEKYDPEKVENLKTTLIKTLKHATNIRSLKPDESVILTVTGSGEVAGTKIIATTATGRNNQQVIVQQKDADGKMTTRILQGNTLDEVGLSSPTVLVIRAKKSDIDAFAKGELDLDKFRTSVQMFSYPYLGGVEVRGDNLGLNINMETNSIGSSSTP